MVYIHSVGDLRTGLITATFPLTGTSWSRPLKDAGTGSGTLDLTDPDNVALSPRYTAAPARSFWMIEWDSVPVWGGIIWSHKYTRKPSRQLTLGAAGLPSLWDHRKVLPALGYASAPLAAANTDLTALSLGTIAKRLVQQAVAAVGGNLPLVLPADVAGTGERHYNAFDLPWLGDMLTALGEVADGPDIEFVPRRVEGNSSYIEWVMRAGNPYLTQAGDPWLWDDTVPESAVTDLSVDIDASKLATRAWVPGTGSEQQMLLGLREDLTLVGAGYPLLEVEDTTHKTTLEQTTLDAHADDLIARRARPIEQWSLKVRADMPPVLGAYAPGDAAVVAVEGDPYIDDGDHALRILGISGNDTAEVTLNVAATAAAV